MNGSQSGGAQAINTLHTASSDHALAIFKLGVVWAGIWIGGTEFPGIRDDQADKIKRLLALEAERLTAVPSVATPWEKSE